MHCGLGIGLAAGKCFAAIDEQGGDLQGGDLPLQGGDFHLQGGDARIGALDRVTAKAVARSASKIANEVLSAQDKKSWRKHHPFFSSKQVARGLQSHIPAPLQLCERLVELKRSE